jgi:hypothetical protein
MTSRVRSLAVGGGKLLLAAIVALLAGLALLIVIAFYTGVELGMGAVAGAIVVGGIVVFVWHRYL